METKLWNFSHNNCKEIVLELPASADERDAIRKGLDRIGLLRTEHPVRAWPCTDDKKPT